MRGRKSRPLHVRLVEKIAVQASGCWLYTGRLNDQGYGLITVGGKDEHVLRAHRVSYEHFVGPVPEGLTLDHVCHNADATCEGGPSCRHRACVNPEHLEPVTRGENVRRGISGVRVRTHCVNGHEYTPENTHWRRGSRECLTCRRNHANAHYHRTKKLRGNAQARKTHCPRGHEYTEANTYWRPDKHGRMCRECKRQLRRERAAA